MEIIYTKNIRYIYKEDDPWLLTTQFGKIKLDIFSRKSSEKKKKKKKKKKRELPSQGRELIDKKTQHTCVSLYIYIYDHSQATGNNNERKREWKDAWIIKE
jgi:hypothetical protein